MGGKIQYTSDKNTAATSSGSLGDAFATAGLGRVALITAPNVVLTMRMVLITKQMD